MLTVRDLVKSFPKGERARKGKEPSDTSSDQTRVLAVKGVSFEVKAGELFTLLGPSGCGKTTTLRAIAGLERPDSGTIELAGKTLFSSRDGVNKAAHERQLGMVFQSYAIWPHLDVYKNVSFPLEVMERGSRPSRSEIRQRVERVLGVTELDSMIHRPATRLSGGQQQRLALSRALVTEPDLMLLDEPLSNLDARLRESMRVELRQLQQDMGLTSIYVTHDQVEALAMSSVIAVMNEGEIVQVGTPKEIYERPKTRFVAEFIGTTNLFDGKVVGEDRGLCRIETDSGVLWSAEGADLSPGADVTVSIRPEDFDLIETGRSAESHNQWDGKVAAQIFLGDTIDHVISVNGHNVRCRSNPSKALPRGESAMLSVEPDKVRMLP